MNSTHKRVAVVVGATSKWQSDGRNTRLVHGKELDDSHLPVGVRWGVGGAIAQKFAQEGFFVVLTTRSAANASMLDNAIKEQGGESMIVELDLVSSDSISKAFAQIRKEVGDPEVLVYNAGYLWRVVTFRLKKNCLNTFPLKCLKPRNTSPVEDHSWWPKRFYPQCVKEVKALS